MRPQTVTLSMAGTGVVLGVGMVMGGSVVVMVVVVIHIKKTH